MLPKEIGELSRLKELHIQSNRLTVLPPELGGTDTAVHYCCSLCLLRMFLIAVLCPCSLTFTMACTYSCFVVYIYSWKMHQNGQQAGV